MIFEPTPLKDAWVISLKRLDDDRGYFARAYCSREFMAHGIDPTIAQCNTSFNKNAGTLRGMHYQVDPAAESKMVRCTRGALYDVIVDMRPDSPTYLKHFGIELTADNQVMLYIPGNFAHGFLTLVPDTQAFYMVGQFYTPGCERGLRHDDPALGITWPAPINVISEKDQQWPLFDGGRA